MNTDSGVDVIGPTLQQTPVGRWRFGKPAGFFDVFLTSAAIGLFQEPADTKAC